MKKMILTILSITAFIYLLAGCEKSNKVTSLLPPEKGEEVVFNASSLLYHNPRTTSYSLGGIGSVFTFSDEMLSIMDNEQIQTYQISYDKITLTVEDFEKQFKKVDEIPDISSYKNCSQYNLHESTNDSPSYRLYVIDDQYWIGTLYRGAIWRVVSLNQDNKY